MAEFPKGEPALSKAGYIYVRDGICQAKECGALIHWYKTPMGHWIAIDSITKTPHWKSCAKPEQFRKDRKKPSPPDPQLEMFQQREPGEEDF